MLVVTKGDERNGRVDKCVQISIGKNKGWDYISHAWENRDTSVCMEIADITVQLSDCWLLKKDPASVIYLVHFLFWKAQKVELRIQEYRHVEQMKPISNNTMYLGKTTTTTP